MQLNPSEISDLLKKRIEGLGVAGRALNGDVFFPQIFVPRAPSCR